MQSSITFQSFPHAITLHLVEEGLAASVQGPNGQLHFTAKQVKCGIMGDMPYHPLLMKIQSAGITSIAAFPFPKEDPTELWLFEAVPMAAPAIRQAKESVKQEQFAKALELFTTACKLQKMQGGQTDELERAICQIQKKQWKQQASLYLPAPEVQHFMDILDAYSDMDDLDTCFEALVQAADKRLPHHHWMAALVCEKQERWQEAIEAYLQLANNQAHAKACMTQVCTLIAKAQLVDRVDAVRLSFEKAIKRLSITSSFPSPTCFICYNAEESDVAEWLRQTLVPHLALAGIRPIVCLHALKIGHDVSNFQEMAQQADLVLVVCTPGLKAKCDQSAKALMGIAQEVRLIKERCSDKDKAGTIFPIFLKGKRQQCLPTAFFGPIWGVKLAQAPFDFHYFTNAFELLAAMLQLGPQAAHLLVEEFGQAIKPIVQGQIDAEEVALWRQSQASTHQALLDAISQRVMQMIKIVNLPLPPASFTGREDELASLQALCQYNQRIAITGLGGVGKTALALHYAHLHQAEYALIHFISAATPQLIIDGLLKLADDLFVPPSAKAEERLSWLKVALDRRKQDFLLIFDGIDQVEAFREIDKYLPEKGRCLLLTSRLKEDCQLLQCQPLELQPLTLEEATNYLLLATSSQEKAQAQALAAKLGCLPLALTHAAGYIRRRGKSMQSYSVLFDRLHLKLFENEQLKLKPEEKTILTTWNISIEAIVHKEKCPLAKDLLAFLAFLAQAAIPLDFVQTWFKNSFPAQHELDLENALAHLCGYSMITSPAPDTYSIHLLVQQVARYQLNSEACEDQIKQALQVCHTFVQELDPDKNHHRLQLTPLIPHFKAIAVYDYHQENFAQLSELLGKIWEYDYYTGRYQELKPIADRCLAICKTIQQRADSLNRLSMTLKTLGKPAEALAYQKQTLEIKEELPDLVNYLNNMGLLLKDLGQHQEALHYHQRALQIAKASQGEERLSLALTFDNMASTLGALGQYSEALSYHLKALEMRKELLGKEHFIVATSLNNVGMTLWKLGQTEKALFYHHQALALWKELFGDKHPDVATSLDNIGLLLDELDQHDEALYHHKQALEMRRELLGEKHLDVAKSLNNIGAVLQGLGRVKEALPYYMQALKLWQELLGDKHIDIATIHNNIGSALGDLDRYEEALNHHKQALKIQKEAFGKRHLHLAESYSSIGLLLQQMGRYQESLKHLTKALELSEAFLGDKHLKIAVALDSKGINLQKLGKLHEALDYCRQALEMKQELLGAEHSHVAASLNNMGSVLLDLGRYQEALGYHIQALQMRKELLGEKHPEVAMSLNNIGSALWQLEQHQEALQYHMQALELTKELFGEKHSKVANDLNNVGLLLMELGRYEEALDCHIQALQMRQELLEEKHPDIGVSLNSMGAVYKASGNYSEAVNYYKRSLEILQHSLGERHPTVAIILDNIGSTLGELNRQEEALQYRMQALDIKKECLGGKHPDVARNLNNVGNVLGDLNRNEEALNYYKQALEASKLALGQKHLDTAMILGNIGSTLKVLNKNEEALQYHLQSMELLKEIKGNKHRSVALSYENIAAILWKIGKHEEALYYWLQALEIHQEILGEKHPELIVRIDNLGCALGKLEMYEDALHYFLKVLEFRKELLGEKHPDVATSLSNVGLTLANLGRYAEGLSYHMQALRLSKELFGEKHPQVALSLHNIRIALEKLEALHTFSRA